ncbi:MAG: recombinase family protein [Ardenticatenaceae bacterium]|nr:recombinase family protein [Ardenticatenaceae bacterium]
MQIALYMRVSTRRQQQSQTIEQQLDRLHSEIEAHSDWKLSEEHIYRDDGYSGASLNRPGLDRLREQAAMASFERVLITAPDRLARKYVHQVLLIEELGSIGCQVEFLDRPMKDGDPHDQLLLQIRGAVAEYERNLIAERMRRGRQAKLRSGTLLPWTVAPYGYLLDAERPRDPSRVQTDPVKAAIVQQIFGWYTDPGQSISLYQVAKRLSDNTIPRGGLRWNVASVRGILRNPAYAGTSYSSRTHPAPARNRKSALKPVGPGQSTRPAPPDDWIAIPVPSIISQATFDLAQDRLDQNQMMARRNNTAHDYLLRGLVSCAQCQLASTGRSCRPGYGYYVCRGRTDALRKAKGERCTARYAPAEQLDELVWQDLCHILSDPTCITHELERAHAGEWLPQALQARRQILRKAIAQLQRQQERLLEVYLAEIIGRGEFERKRHELAQTLGGLEQQLRQLDAQAQKQIDLAALTVNVQDFCQRLQPTLDQLDFAQRRQLVELLIDRVIVDDEQIEIRYVIPVSPAGAISRFCHLRTDYFDLPAGAVPSDDALGLLEGGYGRVGEQQPFDRLVDVGGGIFLADQDGVEGDSWQLLTVGTPGRSQGDGAGAHRHRGLTRRTLVIARHMNAELASDGAAFHFGPQLTHFLIQQGPVRRGTHQQGSLPLLSHGKQLVDVGFPVADGDDFHALGCQRQGLLEGLPPAIACLVLDGQQAPFLRSMRRLVFGPDEDRLGQHAQRQALGRAGQRGMQPKPALFLALRANRTQPFGLGVVGIIQESRVLDRQHPRVLGHPLHRPLLMRRSDAFRCRLIMIKKAIGRLDIRPIFTGLVNRTLGLHGQLYRQLAASIVEASLLQVYRRKLVQAPLIFR